MSTTPDDLTPSGTPEPEKPTRKPPRKSVHTNQAEFIKIHQVMRTACLRFALGRSFQARVRAHREQQRTRIDARHKYIITCVADRLELEEQAVEEFLLDGDQVMVELFA